MLSLLTNFCTSLLGIGVFCGSIILIFLYCLGKFWYSKKRLDSAIHANLKKLLELKDPIEFCKKFEEINEAFEKDPYLVKDWKNFCNYLIFPPQPTTTNDIIKATAPSKFFFDINNYLNNNLNLSKINAVPNYLTGLGILLTFLGLAAGIYHARNGLGSGDITEITVSLSHLLGGASLAFWSSITGLLTSITFSFILKNGIHNSNTLFEKWHYTIDRLIPIVTAEKLAHQQIEELKNQSTQLQRFNTELAVSIAEALDSRLTPQLTLLVDFLKEALIKDILPYIKKMIESMEKIINDRGESTIEMLNEIVNEFVGALNDATGKQFAALASGISSLVEQIKQTEDILKKIQQQMENTTENIDKRITESIEITKSSLTDASEKVSLELIKAGKEVGEKFSEATKNFNNIAENIQTLFNDTIKQLGALINEFSNNITNLNSATENSQKFVTSVTVSAEKMAKITEQLDTSISSFEDITKLFENVVEKNSKTVDKTLETHDNIKNILSNLKEERNAFINMWYNYEEKFNNLHENLGKVFTELNGGLEMYAQKLRDYVIDMERHLASGVETLSAAVGELREVIEDIEDLSDNLKVIVKN